MRTIKFRGKDKSGCWHVGWLAETNDGTIYIAENDEGWTDDGFHNDDFSGWYKVLERTVGQFTGLFDKNGEEIYEGDIVKCDKFVYEVVFEENRFASFGLCRKGDMFMHYFGEAMESQQCEVIGNIHDNKELIGE